MSIILPEKKLILTFCFGTSCFIRGARELYAGLKDYVKARGIDHNIEFMVTLCTEQCQMGPVLSVGDTVIARCTVDKAAEEIEKCLARRESPNN